MTTQRKQETRQRKNVEQARWLPLLASASAVERAEATEHLCASVEPLVRSQAMHYRQSIIGAELDDLLQVGRLGALEACRTFDGREARNVVALFARHAVWCIRDALAKCIERLEHPVRLPAGLVRQLPKLRRTTVRLGHELGREPTVEELTAAMNDGVKKAKERFDVSEIIGMQAYDDPPVQMDAVWQKEQVANPNGLERYVIERFWAETSEPEIAECAEEDEAAVRAAVEKESEKS